MSLDNLTIKKAQKLLADKEISVQELVLHYFKKIEEKNKNINAYLEVFDDALSEAEKLDKEGIGGRTLFGVPLAVKDNILIKGKICSAGSRMLQNYKASYDATVIKKLKSAGAIFLGRTNMDEFAMGASTENSAYGATKILMIYRESPADLPAAAPRRWRWTAVWALWVRTQAVLSGSRRLFAERSG